MIAGIVGHHSSRVQVPARLVAGLATLTIVVGSTSACDPPPPNLIVIGVTATANEPAPSLTAKAKQTLKAAIAKHEAKLAIYVAQQGASNTRELLRHDVTVRRGNSASGEVETNEELINQGLTKNLDDPLKVLSSASSDSGQLNLFDLLNDMASVPGRATLIVISSGLQTVNEMDLTQYGSDLNAPDLVISLPENSMHDLRGKTVIFSLPGWGKRRDHKKR
jgi:OmpA-OmpF porin, OOP family